jgi:hypothetical protein
MAMTINCRVKTNCDEISSHLFKILLLLEKVGLHDLTIHQTSRLKIAIVI